MSSTRSQSQLRTAIPIDKYVYKYIYRYVYGIPLSQEVVYTILLLLCFQKSSKYLINIL